MTASTTPAWSRLSINTVPHDEDDDCRCEPSTTPATPVSVKLPIKTRIPFPQTLPLRMELPIRAMLSLQHEREAPQLQTRQQQQVTTVPADPCDCRDERDECEDDPPACPGPLPAERTMAKLVPRSPYWQAQQAAFIARNRSLDELTLLRQAVQDLDGRFEQFKWPDPLKVQTHMSADDIRRIENCENAVLGYAEQLKQHESQLQWTQTQLKTAQAQLDRVENRLQAYDAKLDAILKRLSAAPQVAATKTPPVKAARKAAAKKTAQP